MGSFSWAWVAFCIMGAIEGVLRRSALDLHNDITRPDAACLDALERRVELHLSITLSLGFPWVLWSAGVIVISYLYQIPKEFFDDFQYRIRLRNPFPFHKDPFITHFQWLSCQWIYISCCENQSFQSKASGKNRQFGRTRWE